MRCSFFTVSLVAACTTVAVANSYDDAVSAAERGDYTRAARLLRSFAENGDTRAQGSLGRAYYMGQDVSQNAKEVLKWLC
jgi:TPR repeat protein